LLPANKYSEEELVYALQTKNEDGFTYLYNNYSGALYNVVNSIIPQADIAADVLQEVFVKIYRKIDSYDASKSRLYTWMVQIARNESIDTTRNKNYKASKQNQELTENVYDSAGSTNMAIDKIGLRKILNELKPDLKAVLELSYFGGLTQDEISKELNIPIGTVKTRLRTALINLRTIIK
jgi:RNA polymerase sigma factor (sigma-70 family)